VSPARKAAVALFGTAWIALATAVVAVFFTTADYCDELGTPTGLSISNYAMLSAFCATVLAVAVGIRGQGPPRFGVAFMATVVTLIALFGVAVLVYARAGDGGNCG
jgi:hypothetical protein